MASQPPKPLKFNVNAAAFDPTSVSAAVAGMLGGTPGTASSEGTPSALQQSGTPTTGASPGVPGAGGAKAGQAPASNMAAMYAAMGVGAPGVGGAPPPMTETRVIFRSVPKSVDTVALIKCCEMQLGHVVGCDFSSSTGLGVVTFQLPASAAMAVQCSGMPVFPGMPPFHISLAKHEELKVPCSNSLVLRGLPSQATRSDALRAVCSVHPLPTAMELHLREKGEVWLRYADLDAAAEAAKALHGATPPEAAAEGGAGSLSVAYKRADPVKLSEKNIIAYTEEGVPVQTLHRHPPSSGHEGGGGTPSRSGRRAFGAGHAASTRRGRSDSVDSTASASSGASWRWEGAGGPTPSEAAITSASASAHPRTRSRGSSISSGAEGGSAKKGAELDWGALRRGPVEGGGTKTAQRGRGASADGSAAMQGGSRGGSRKGRQGGSNRKAARNRGQSESAAPAQGGGQGVPPSDMFMSALVAGAKEGGTGQ